MALHYTRAITSPIGLNIEITNIESHDNLTIRQQLTVLDWGEIMDYKKNKEGNGIIVKLVELTEAGEAFKNLYQKKIRHKFSGGYIDIDKFS